MTTIRKPPTLEEQRRYVQQWKQTGEELRLIKMAELAAMTDEEAQRATQDLLLMAEGAYFNPKYLTYSGLIEQQRIFHRL